MSHRLPSQAQQHNTTLSVGPGQRFKSNTAVGLQATSCNVVTESEFTAQQAKYSTFRSMTHAPETGAIDPLHFYGADMWYMCCANRGSDSSGARFRRRLEHCSIPSQKVTCE